MQRTQEAYAKKFQTSVKKLLADQLAEVLGNLPGQEKGLKAADGPGTFDEAAWNSAFEDKLVALMYELSLAQGKLAMEFAGEKELQFELIRALQEKINDRLALMAKNYNAETIKQLKAVMQDAQVEGLALAEIKKRVENVYDVAKGYRAERIARTESIASANLSTIEGYRQVGYVTGKEWFTNPGACQYCESLSGKIISLDKNFVELGGSIEGADGSSYSVDYEAVGGPPAHPNCTCTVIPFRGDL